MQLIKEAEEKAARENAKEKPEGKSKKNQSTQKRQSYQKDSIQTATGPASNVNY